jgi:hypothetical protein
VDCLSVVFSPVEEELARMASDRGDVRVEIIEWCKLLFNGMESDLGRDMEYKSDGDRTARLVEVEYANKDTRPRPEMTSDLPAATTGRMKAVRIIVRDEYTFC